MIFLIIGHRGTGKSHWLKVISQIHKEKGKDTLCFDLDKEIETFSQKSVMDLFEEGESIFREWEQKTFQKIIRSLPKDKLVFISVGAGFVLKHKKDIRVIYLCRLTDKDGRIFFNRPTLDTQKSSIDEYLSLYHKRHAYYMKIKDEIFYRLEHFKEAYFFDYLFFNLKEMTAPLFSLRLTPSSLPKGKEEEFLEKRLKWGIRFFELHDEDVNDEFIKKVIKIIPKNQILFSSQFNHKFKSITDKKHWSWDLDLGRPPQGVTILSLHERSNRPLPEILKSFSSYKKYHLKLAIEIFNLKELWQGYLWYKEDPKKRTFLPRSLNGKWKWFRNAFGSQMFLHFIHEGDSKIKDQPLFCEAVHFQGNHKKFAGVMGSPIHFSATPFEHHNFFYEQRSIPVLTLLWEEKDMTRENFKILQQFGFVFFAITSPLKQKAFECADINNTAHLESVNTFILNQNKWYAYNTDQEGLKDLEKEKGKAIAVWGGGGVKTPLRSFLSQAIFYSARTRKNREGREAPYPEVLIWAVGAYRIQQGCLFPPSEWKPRKVIDLNYTEDSPGREYSKRVKAEYQNGEFLFKKQAEKQRELYFKWEKK